MSQVEEEAADASSVARLYCWHVTPGCNGDSQLTYTSVEAGLLGAGLSLSGTDTLQYVKNTQKNTQTYVNNRPTQIIEMP